MVKVVSFNSLTNQSVVMKLIKTSKFHWILVARSSIVLELGPSGTILSISFSQPNL